MKRVLVLCSIAFLLAACGSNSTKPDNATTPEKPAEKKEKEAVQPVAETKRPPIINITDTLSVKRTVIYIKDSAATAERMMIKLPEILNFKLDAVIKKNKINIVGRPIVWYYSSKAPYFFEAGIPVDKKPVKMPSHVMVREMGVDSVTVAHFYGSYDLLPQAYEALNDWMSSHHKKPNGRPYEVYVDDPRDKDGKMKDPYKVQTDVIFPWK